MEESQNSKNQIKYIGKKQCLINCSLGDLTPLSSEREGGEMVQYLAMLPILKVNKI